MIRAVIADDEELARLRLRDLLAAEGGVEVVGEAGTGAAAVEAVQALAPDLVFLDIEMPVMDGLQAARVLSAGSGARIVFVTAYDQYAVQAFEANALDYLLKPVQQERLSAAVTRHRAAALSRIEMERQLAAVRAAVESITVARQYPARFLVRDGDRFVPVAADDVEWVSSEQNYVSLHLADKRYLLRGTIDGMEEKLDPERFVRVRRSAIVNISRIASVRAWSGTEFEITLQSGARVFSSRQYRHAVRDLLMR